MHPKTLIVAPHMDDEVLGCSSFLATSGTTLPHFNTSPANKYTTVFYHSCTHPVVPYEILKKENDRLVKTLGINRIISKMASGPRRSKKYSDLLDTIPIRDLVNEFEEILTQGGYHTVLIPNPSYNQDHRQIYEAALTALRPHDRIPFVARVLVYEEVETLGTLRNVTPFRPTYFRSIPIKVKIGLYHFYQSQVRNHRSVEQIEHLAGIRGAQSDYRYAEAFEVLRWVE